MVAIPCVSHCLPGILRSAMHEMEGRHGSECFSFTVLVWWGEVNCSTWGAIMLPCDHHVVTPCHRLAIGYTLDYA